MYFKNAIDAIGHTPLVELPQTSPNKKVRIFAKLEGQNLGGSASIKDRIAKYMIEKAEQNGELTRDKTIIESTSGQYRDSHSLARIQARLWGHYCHA